MVENKLGQEKPRFTPGKVVYSGGSHRRAEFISYLYPELKVETLPFDHEPETIDIVGVVDWKLDQAIEKVSSNGVGTAIVAADIRTLTPFISNGHGLELKSSSKPQSLSEVAENFKNIASNARKHGEPPFYIVEAASGIHNLEEQTRQIERNHSLVFLSEQGLDYLGTEEGFAEYVRVFREFYSTPPYSTHNMPAIEPTEIAAGLSLPVLTQMGVIDAINRAKREDQNFEEEFKKALFIVGVGFSPKILEQIEEQSSPRINEWSWINQVAEKVLNSGYE